MATIASNVTWGSGPAITFDFSYEKMRVGSTQYYKITVNCDSVTGSHYFGYPIYLDLKLDGATAATHTLKAANPSQWSSAISYTTSWIEVRNKTTGTTSLAIRIYSGSGSTRNTTYTYSLDIDPALSKVSVNFTPKIGSPCVIFVNQYDSSFTTTVSYIAEGQSVATLLWDREKRTSFEWVIPNDLYALIPDNDKINITLYCLTQKDGKLISANPEITTITVYANEEECKPVVEAWAEDVNPKSINLTENPKRIISDISTLRVNTTAAARNGASITSIRAYCGNSSKSGASVEFTKVSTPEVYVIVTDSRGFSTRFDITDLTVLWYTAPTLTANVVREAPTSNDVTVTVKGRWFNNSFGAVTNTLRIRVRYKVADASTYGEYVEIPVTSSSYEYTATITLSEISYTTAHNFQIRLDDVLHTDGGYTDATYTTLSLSKGIPVFDWGEDDFNFNVPVNIKAGINIIPEDGTSPIGETGATAMPLIYIVQQGVSGNWTYRLWSDGMAELWGIITAIHHNGSILGGEMRFPFSLTGSIYGIATLNSAGGNSGAALPWNVKLVYNTELCGAWVHNSGNVGFAVDSTAAVSVYIVGRWKQ